MHYGQFDLSAKKFLVSLAYGKQERYIEKDLSKQHKVQRKVKSCFICQESNNLEA